MFSGVIEIYSGKLELKSGKAGNEGKKGPRERERTNKEGIVWRLFPTRRGNSWGREGG